MNEQPTTVSPCPHCGTPGRLLNVTRQLMLCDECDLALTPDVWARLSAAARLQGAIQTIEAWLKQHGMNGIMVHYRGGRFTLNASGMVSPKHLGRITDADGADYATALLRLAGAVEEKGDANGD